MLYDWDFSVLADPGTQRFLLDGVLITLQLTVWCIVVGTPLGVLLGSLPFLNSLVGSSERASFRGTSVGGVATPMGLGRMIAGLGSWLSWRSLPSTAVRLIAWGAMLLIDLVRAIPLLLLMLICYYGLPVLFGDRVSGFAAAAVAMTVNLSAFVGDLVRGSAAAVSKGSILAARSLGMSRLLTWRRIVLPEVFREILPGLSLLYITMLKMSTLASTIAVYELLHSADAVIQRTYKPLELYLAMCVLFVAMILPLAWTARRFEQSQTFRRRS